MIMSRFLIVSLLHLAVGAAGSRALGAQSLDALLARGDSLHAVLQPAQALEAYRAAFLRDPTSYEAMWKFARSQIDVAKQLSNDHTTRRDSLYRVARLYAEAAVRTDSLAPAGHFMLALALGYQSRTKGGQERVRFAKEIYNEAARVLQLDGTHAGAHHVLGAWHAEIRRLSGLARFFAKTFLGGGFMERASWDSAAAHLEQAVMLEPEHVFHRLELAEIYVDIGRPAAAREQLQHIAGLPPTTDVLDPEYKRRAADLLARLP